MTNLYPPKKIKKDMIIIIRKFSPIIYLNLAIIPKELSRLLLISAMDFIINKFWKLSNIKSIKNIKKYSSKLGLQHLLKYPISQLSIGEKQLVQIARVLISQLINFAVILMDHNYLSNCRYLKM